MVTILADMSQKRFHIAFTNSASTLRFQIALPNRAPESRSRIALTVGYNGCIPGHRGLITRQRVSDRERWTEVCEDLPTARAVLHELSVVRATCATRRRVARVSANSPFALCAARSRVAVQLLASSARPVPVGPSSLFQAAFAASSKPMRRFRLPPMTFSMSSSGKPFRSSTKVIGSDHALGVRVVRAEQHAVGTRAAR